MKNISKYYNELFSIDKIAIYLSFVTIWLFFSVESAALKKEP